MPSSSPETPPKNPSIIASLVVCAVFFLSGASALVLEIAWTRRLELLLGNSVFAATTIIAVYMLGLGVGSLFGSRLARRRGSPLLTYAALELLIIVWALLVPLLLLGLDFLFPLLARIPGLHTPEGTPLALRLLGSLVIFGVPTLLMGATLPVMIQAVASRAAGFATRFSALYSGNTLGAVAGSLAAGFILLPKFGVATTVMIALSFNLAAAVVALLLSKAPAFKTRPGKEEEAVPAKADTSDEPEADSSSPVPAKKSRFANAVPAAFAFSAGFLALYLEVFWFRTLILVFGSTTYSLSAMLAIFLAGTAFGPLLLGWIGDRGALAKHLVVLVCLCLFGAGISIIFSLNFIGHLPNRFLEELAANEFSWNQLLRAKFVHSAQIIFIPALLLSAVLPACAKAFRGTESGSTSADAAANVYLANTIGATAGVVLAGFVLLPTFGLYRGLLWAGAACLLLAVIGIVFLGTEPRLRAIIPVLTIFLALVWFVFREPWNEKKFAIGAYFHPGAHSASGAVRFDEVLDTSRLLLYREGMSATVSVLRSHDDMLRYMSNGKVEADTDIRAMINQSLLGHLPMLLHPGEPKRVMNIGLGAGVTLGAMGRYPATEQLDVVEIEPAVTLAADHFAPYNFDVLEHPKITIYNNDARNFLLTTENRYDVICSDPFEPVVAGVIHLFTKEHFELARERLTDEGILCQWIPMYELSLEDYSTLVGTFVSVFPQSLYFSTGADSILIGFKDRVRLDPEKLAARLEHPDVRSSLETVGLTKPEFIWSMLIADFTVSPPGRPARLNTDDHPWVEFSAPRHALATTHIANRQLQLDLFQSMRAKESASAFLGAFPDEERQAINRQQTALQEALEAGLAVAKEDIQPALETAARAYALAPDNPIVRDEVAAIYHLGGDVALRQGDHETAIRLLRDAYRIQPVKFRHLYRLALAYLRSGQPDKAAPLLAQGMRQFPDSPFFYSLQGSLSLEQGDMKQALAFHQAAVQKSPRLDHLWEQFERTAQFAGKPELVEKINKERKLATAP